MILTGGKMSKVVWSLFEGSGFMVKPWADAGYTCYCFNADLGDHGPYEMRVEHPNIHYVDTWISPGWEPMKTIMTSEGMAEPMPAPDIIFAFPPCTHMAQSGAQHDRDPAVIEEAVSLARVAKVLGDKYGCPWMVENPVGSLSTMWERPHYYFHPCDYGGYLDAGEGMYHPRMPERNGYNKKTCIWAGNAFRMPEKKPVESCGYFWGWRWTGGNSARTKQLRSLTPEGFARAVFDANHLLISLI